MTEYVVMTMCHCGEPDCCDDHWAVGIPLERYDPETGHVAQATDMTEGFHSREDAQLFANAKNGDELRAATDTAERDSGRDNDG